MLKHELSISDLEFRAAFEAGAFAPADFSHRAHVRLAYVYLADCDVDLALERMRAALVSFLSHHDIPASKYHETLTRSWLLAVNHFIDDKGFIWVGEARTARLLKFDQQGNFLYSWGAPGGQSGRLRCSHGMSTDQLGNLYLADCFAGRVQKFEPIPGADKSKIAGQILRTWDSWKKP
jgi:hypothetical protein